MSLEHKVYIGMAIRAVPYLAVMLGSAMFACKRHVLLGALLFVGCLAVACEDIWSVYLALWVRTHSVQEQAGVIRLFAWTRLVGLYVFCGALNAMFWGWRKQSDNEQVLTDG